MLPETMTCIEISTPGGPEVLKPATRAVPAPKAGEVLIKVAAAGVNRPDVVQRQGLYPAPPGASDLPGLEVAGKVVALGEGVSSPALGAEICALVPGGGYAEYCTTDARHCMPIPKGYDMVKAAALPETFFTVWHNVVERGQLKSGEKFLVHGGAGGIGTTAIQLAKALGATVFTTANGEAKCASCRALGADLAIDYSSADFVEVIKEQTKGKGVDVILDMVGGDYMVRNIKSLAFDGRLVSIAFMKGSTAELNMMPVMLKRLTLTGSTLRPQSNDAKARMATGLSRTMWPLLDEGRIAPVIHKVFPLADAAGAHALMESSAHIGKIVLQV
jgi:NADPH2:quinone reductase